jgi:hypothetical protein
MLVGFSTTKGQIFDLRSEIQTDETLICPGNSVTLNVIATGGTGVYTYTWVSSPHDPSLVGQENLQSITVTPLGNTKYEVYVNDGYIYVISEVNIWISEPLNVRFIDTLDVICKGEYILLYPVVAGGCNVNSYQWSSYPEGFSSDDEIIYIMPTDNTWYICEVTNGLEVERDSIFIEIEDQDIYAVSGGGTFCPSSNGKEIKLSGSTEGVKYTLHPVDVEMNGTGTPLSFGYINLTGDYYVIAYNTLSGCTAEMLNSVSLEHFSYQEQICAVTVDPITGLIKVLWEESDPFAVSGYKIFREATNGAMEIIGEVDAGNLNFTDINANSLQRAYVYGLSTIDTCGSEIMSETHKTIHLSINQGLNAINLIWTPYLGISYNTYYIHRRESGGNFQLIDSVPASVTSYSDINPPSNVNDYIVSLKMNSACNSSRNNPANIYSNIGSVPLGVPENYSDHTIHTELTNGKLIIRSNQMIDRLYLFSPLGLINSYNINDNHAEINVSFLASGIYIMKATVNNKAYVKKLIVL